jgi:hypothetical protein
MGPIDNLTNLLDHDKAKFPGINSFPSLNSYGMAHLEKEKCSYRNNIEPKFNSWLYLFKKNIYLLCFRIKEESLILLRV